MDRVIRAYQIAFDLNCPFILASIINKYKNTTFSSQWFMKFCTSKGINLLNAQSLEDKRQQFFNEAILNRFHDYISTLIHNEPDFIYNVDEAYCSYNHKGKVVVPHGKNPFVIDEKNFGHMTAIWCINAAGDSLQSFFILPHLQKLLEELHNFSNWFFLSTPFSWMTANVIFIWSLFFVSEVNKKRIILSRRIGEKAFNTPVLLFLDGHKSRINSLVIELFAMNSIKVIVFPGHISHVIQTFDYSVAGTLKVVLQKRKKNNIPKRVEKRVSTITLTAKKRYIMILRLLDAWNQTATISNIKSGWEALGLCPFDKQSLFSNKFVRKTTSITDKPPVSKNGIQMNSMETTTIAKRIEIARYFYNQLFPNTYEIYTKIRN